MRRHAARLHGSLMNSRRSARIRVKGRLSRRLVSGFEEMCIEAGDKTTDLVGEGIDQAQLYGLLTRLRDLGLELESVDVADESSLVPAEDAESSCQTSSSSRRSAYD